MSQINGRTAPEAETHAAEIGARLERLPFTRHQAYLAAILGGCQAADVIDLTALTYLLAPISESLNFDPTRAGVATSAVFLGVAFGALIGGLLADRFGRRAMLIASMLVWGPASLATVFAWDLTSFAAFRLITGVGLGATLPIVFTMITEFVPSNKRGNVMGAMALVASGLTIAFNGLSYLAVSQLGEELGWRAMFVLLSASALQALLVWRWVPESPRWCASMGRHTQAETIMSQVEAKAEAAYRNPLPPPQPEMTKKSTPTAAAPKSTWRALFDGGQARQTLFIWSFWFLSLLGLYGIGMWLGKFLVDRGMTSSQSIGLGVLMTIGSLPGAWMAGYLLDKIGRKPVLVTTMLLYTVVAIAYSQATGVVWIALAGFLLFFAQTGMATASYTYTAELFPTRVRVTGMGSASMIGRIAAICGPIVVPLIMLRWGYATAFAALAACIGIAALMVLLVGTETRRAET
jgi:putative MFS transporter